jgi:threonine/homoserine/homoserine lactone efflux protein
MADPFGFILAVLMLLGTPGPTNTLLAASGAAVGAGHSVKLIAAEVGGYVLAISLLIAVVGPVVADHAWFGAALRLAAGAWLAFCALRLWREAASGFSLTETPISMGRMFLTTTLNPKALIFAFVIFPPGTLGQVTPWFAAFAACTAVAGGLWIGCGVVLERSLRDRVAPRRIWQAAAVVLAVFAVAVAGSAVGVV